MTDDPGPAYKVWVEVEQLQDVGGHLDYVPIGDSSNLLPINIAEFDDFKLLVSFICMLAAMFNAEAEDWKGLQGDQVEIDPDATGQPGAGVPDR